MHTIAYDLCYVSKSRIFKKLTQRHQTHYPPVADEVCDVGIGDTTLVSSDVTGNGCIKRNCKAPIAPPPRLRLSSGTDFCGYKYKHKQKHKQKQKYKYKYKHKYKYRFCTSLLPDCE